MLTGTKIKQQIEKGKIIISPFELEQLNPNSYDLRLAKIITQENDYDENSWKEIKPQYLEKDGLNAYALEPGKLYLGSTYEVAGSKHYISKIEGKSSIARKGLVVHLTAGFGDIGFVNHWTLEIINFSKTIIYLYQGMRICQITFTEPAGDTSLQYNGKYKELNPNPVPSRLDQSLIKDRENISKIQKILENKA